MYYVTACSDVNCYTLSSMKATNKSNVHLKQLHLNLNMLKFASVFHFQGAEFKGFEVQDENSSAPVRAGRNACKRKCVFRCKLS